MTPTPSQDNVQSIEKVKRDIHIVLNGCPITLNNSNLSADCYSKTSPEPSTDLLLDLPAYQKRLSTFVGEWNLDFISPEQMAKAGFYYMGTQDRVKCYYCSNEFVCWQQGDDPLVEHKRKSPDCQFFNGSRGSDVCGFYSSDFGIDNPAKKVEHLLDPLGYVQKIGGSMFLEMTSFESRMKTFDKCEIQLKLDIRSLCEAGFFYKGDGLNDLVNCFYCGQNLRDWEDNDDAWIEHARWSPNCSYVILSKGKEYVDKACGLIKDEPDIIQEDLSEMNVDDKDTSIVEDDDKIITKRKIDQAVTTDNDQVKTLSSEINLSHSQQQDLSTLPDSMMCKICLQDKVKVAFMPCGHIFACVQCAVALDQCAVCRSLFKKAMRVFVQMDEEKDQNPGQLTCSSSQNSDEPSDPLICKVCHKKSMKAVFIPCRHVYSCDQCAAEMDECPVCAESFCGTMQVFFS